MSLEGQVQTVILLLSRGRFDFVQVVATLNSFKYVEDAGELAMLDAPLEYNRVALVERGLRTARHRAVVARLHREADHRAPRKPGVGVRLKQMAGVKNGLQILIDRRELRFIVLL